MTDKSIDDLLDDADFPEHPVPICLKGSLRQKWEAAEAALAEVNERVDAHRRPDGGSGAPSGLIRERRIAAEAVKAVQDEMAAASIDFLIRGRDFAAYNRLMLKHPPREGNRTDTMAGFNTETFHVANVKASIVTPALTDAQWAKLLANLTDRQFDELARAAIEVNRREDGSVPFSLSASEAMRDSAGTSPSPDDSE